MDPEEQGAGALLNSWPAAVAARAIAVLTPASPVLQQWKTTE